MSDLFTTYPDAPGFKAGATSREAAEAIAPSQKTLHAQVLEALRLFPKGLTADETARYLDRSELAIRPRLSELVGLGEVIRTNRRRRNRSGLQASIYQVAPHGKG